MTVLPADFAAALKLLAEVVTEPAFSTQDFDRVKNEWLDAVRAERQDPQRLAAVTAFRALNGPIFGAPVNGTLADLRRLAVGDLRDFHARAYTPDNSALIVVGSLDAAGIKAEVEQKLGAWRGKNRIVQVAAPPRAPAVQRVLYVDRPDAVQTAISAVQSFPVRSEPGYEAREIVVTTLGGLFTSRLNTNLREQHAFTYGAFAHSQEGPVTRHATGRDQRAHSRHGRRAGRDPLGAHGARWIQATDAGGAHALARRSAIFAGRDARTPEPDREHARQPRHGRPSARLLRALPHHDPGGRTGADPGRCQAPAAQRHVDRPWSAIRAVPTALTKAGFKAEAAPPELSE